MIKPGDRVRTINGKGTVAYVRKGGQDFAEVVAVSVVLDDKRSQVGYTGSMYPVGEVWLACRCPTCACGTGHTACRCPSPYYQVPKCLGLEVEP